MLGAGEAQIFAQNLEQRLVGAKAVSALSPLT